MAGSNDAGVKAGGGRKPGEGPLAGGEAEVEGALGADPKVFLELGAVEGGAAAVALLPQAFGNAALAAAVQAGDVVFTLETHPLAEVQVAWARQREGAKAKLILIVGFYAEPVWDRFAAEGNIVLRRPVSVGGIVDQEKRL